MEEITTGLLLQAIPYLEGQHVLKVLTAQHGLLTLLSPRSTPPALSSPFVWAEWVYKVSAKQMHFLKSSCLLDDLRALKTQFAILSAAGQIANDLLHTQFPGKNGTDPLRLALACLRKLPIFREPAQLHASFRLKLLLHEGVLREEELSSPSLRTLALSRSFQELAALPCLADDLRQVDAFFQRLLVT